MKRFMEIGPMENKVLVVKIEDAISAIAAIFNGLGTDACNKIIIGNIVEILQKHPDNISSTIPQDVYSKIVEFVEMPVAHLHAVAVATHTLALVYTALGLDVDELTAMLRMVDCGGQFSA